MVVKVGRKRLVFAIHGSDKPFAGVLPANCCGVGKTLRNPVFILQHIHTAYFCRSPACW